MSHNIPVSKPLSVAVFAILGRTRFEKGFLKSHCMPFLGTLWGEGLLGYLLACLLCFLRGFFSCMEGDNVLLAEKDRKTWDYVHHISQLYFQC